MQSVNHDPYFSDEDEKKEKKVRKLRKKDIGRAPRSLIKMSNPDKKKHEYYKKGQNPIRFPKPFRCVILGKVNSGKSYLARHILLAHQGCAPKFEEIHIVHGCFDTHTTEYDDIEATSIMNNIPHYSEFDPDIHKLLILDDVDFTMMPNIELRNLSELVRFGSTHCNMSIMLLHQSWFRIPKIVKDTANVFIIFRPHDNDELGTIGRRVGLKKNKIFDIFNNHLPEWRDSLCINLIPGAQHKFSKNLFEPIVEADVDEDED
jgi:hypothetical protein